MTALTTPCHNASLLITTRTEGRAYVSEQVPDEVSCTAEGCFNTWSATGTVVGDYVDPHEPCAAETHSWDHFRPEQVDSYWITCDLVGPHDEHEDQHTGLTWRDPSTIRDVTPPKEKE